MYCSKCENKINDSSKYCKYCGNEITDNRDIDNLQTMKIEKDNKYVIKRNYGIIIFLCILLIPLTISLISHNMLTGLVEGFCVLIAIASVTVATTNIIFECPNCKEKVQISQNKLEDINESISSCKCPKCNTDLVFNTNEQIVNINNSGEKETISNSNNTSSTKIEELYNLKVKGIITEEEFEIKKKELLEKI